MGELYRSENLCVRATPGRDTTRWFITFAPVDDDARLDREGFGEAYFQSRDISVVSVVGRGNDWYQYPDMALALAMIDRALRDARIRITYGSSMGGYAAIRFADAVGATACLALSPQYSNDPHKVPFDDRWKQQGRATKWLSDLDGPIRGGVTPVLVYDNRDSDAEHVRLIARDMRVASVAIPYGGHPVTTYLSSAGLLGALIDAMYNDALDTEMFQRIARERRKTSAAWVGELARRQPACRARLGVRLARRALELYPDNDLFSHILAQRLEMNGLCDEAMAMHRRAYDLSGRQRCYGMPYSRALHAAGAIDDALDIAIDLQGRFPHCLHTAEWVAELKGRVSGSPVDMGYRDPLAQRRKRMRMRRGSLPLLKFRKWLDRSVSGFIGPGMRR